MARAKPKPTVRQREIRSAANAGIKTVRAKYEAKSASEERIASAKTAQRVITAEETERARTRGYYQRHVGTRAVGAIASGSKPVVNPIFLVIGTMAGLIIFYDFVTHGPQAAGFFASLSNGLSKLSSTSPLFVKAQTS